MCISTETECEYSLARFNGHVDPLARFDRRDTHTSSALQDYQMQMMLLEQQNKKRLLMARQEQDGSGYPSRLLPNSAPSRNTALQDYQLQLMLLEQQNVRRKMMLPHNPMAQNPIVSAQYSTWPPVSTSTGP